MVREEHDGGSEYALRGITLRGRQDMAFLEHQILMLLASSSLQRFNKGTEKCMFLNASSPCTNKVYRKVQQSRLVERYFETCIREALGSNFGWKPNIVTVSFKANSGTVPRFCYCFLSDPFKFIIYQSSYHPMLMVTIFTASLSKQLEERKV